MQARVLSLSCCSSHSFTATCIVPASQTERPRVDLTFNDFDDRTIERRYIQNRSRIVGFDQWRPESVTVSMNRTVRCLPRVRHDKKCRFCDLYSQTFLRRNSEFTSEFLLRQLSDHFCLCYGTPEHLTAVGTTLASSSGQSRCVDGSLPPYGVGHRPHSDRMNESLSLNGEEATDTTAVTTAAIRRRRKEEFIQSSNRLSIFQGEGHSNGKYF